MNEWSHDITQHMMLLNASAKTISHKHLIYYENTSGENKQKIG